MDRQEFIKRGNGAGPLGVGAIGSVARRLRHAPLASGAPTAAKAGGRLRVGIIPPPVGSLDPHTYLDQGGLTTGGIAGES